MLGGRRGPFADETAGGGLCWLAVAFLGGMRLNR